MAEIKVVDEPVTVVVSAKGWVRALKGHEVDAATLAFKAGDALYGTFACRSVDTLLVFGSAAKGSGRVYSVAVVGAARRARRRRADHHADRPGARHAAGALLRRRRPTPRCCWPTAAASACWPRPATCGPQPRRQELPDAGRRLTSLLPPVAVAPAHTQVACLALDGRLLVFPLDELKLQANGGKGPDADGRGRQGRRCCRWPRCADRLRVVGTGRGGKPREEELQGRRAGPARRARARKGRKVDGFVKALQLSAA